MIRVYGSICTKCTQQLPRVAACVSPCSAWFHTSAATAQRGSSQRTMSLRDVTRPSEIIDLLNGKECELVEFGPALVKCTGYFHQVSNAERAASPGSHTVSNRRNRGAPSSKRPPVDVRELEKGQEETKALWDIVKQLEVALLHKGDTQELPLGVAADLLNPLCFLLMQQHRNYVDVVRNGGRREDQHLREQILRKAFELSQQLVHHMEKRVEELPTNRDDFRKVFLSLARASTTVRVLKGGKRNKVVDNTNLNEVVDSIMRFAARVYNKILEIPAKPIASSDTFHSAPDPGFARMVWETGFSLLDFLIRHEFIQAGSPEIREIFRRLSLHQAGFFCFSFFENFTTLTELPFEESVIRSQIAILQERIKLASDQELYSLRNQDRFNVVVSGSTVHKSPTEEGNEAIARLIKLVREQGGEGTELVYLLYRFRAAAKLCWANRPMSAYEDRDDDPASTPFILYQESLKLCEGIADSIVNSRAANPKCRVDITTIPAYHLCRLLRAMASIGHRDPNLYECIAQEVSKRIRGGQFCNREQTVSQVARRNSGSIQVTSPAEVSHDDDLYDPIVHSYTEPLLASFVGHDLAVYSVSMKDPERIFQTCVLPILSYITECYRPQLESFHAKVSDAIDTSTMEDLTAITESVYDEVDLDYPLDQVVSKNVMSGLAGTDSFELGTDSISPLFKTLAVAARAQHNVHMERISEKYGHPCELTVEGRTVYMSTMEFDVYKILENFGSSLPHIHYMTKQGLTVDFAYPDQRIAVEVDGPYHFDPVLLESQNQQDQHGLTRLNAFSVFKQTVLEREGWNVIRIPVYDWISLLKNEEKVRVIFHHCACINSANFTLLAD
eukprot:gb/GECG01012468.1/.p1 GENE.gb/GECG01012468.1/~~gb/GECG01012468.1/.p1  ORF type:complete len:844 (+),score=76.81 gb/GECG01012468.1/:1-2532(+)